MVSRISRITNTTLYDNVNVIYHMETKLLALPVLLVYQNVQHHPVDQLVPMLFQMTKYSPKTALHTHSSSFDAPCTSKSILACQSLKKWMRLFLVKLIFLTQCLWYYGCIKVSCSNETWHAEGTNELTRGPLSPGSPLSPVKPVIPCNGVHMCEIFMLSQKRHKSVFAAN